MDEVSRAVPLSVIFLGLVGLFLARSAVAAVCDTVGRVALRRAEPWSAEAAEWGRIFEAASCLSRMPNPMCTLAFLNMSMSDALQTLMVAFDKFIFTGN